MMAGGWPGGAALEQQDPPSQLVGNLKLRDQFVLSVTLEETSRCDGD